MSKAPPAITPSRSRRRARRRVTERATQTLPLRAKQRGSVSVPLSGKAAGAGTFNVKVTGPSGFTLERTYVLDVKPATQVLARRTVKPLAKGESLTLSSDMFADLVAGIGRGVGLGRSLDRARRGRDPQGARPLSVRLFRTDHQPRAAAAVCERAREIRAARDGYRGRSAHPRCHRPAAGAAGLRRLVRAVVASAARMSGSTPM